MKKSVSIFATPSLLVVLIAIVLIPRPVLADGMVLQFDPYADRWDYSGEQSQQAFINYENGLQKMIVSIGLEGENSKDAVWLFPVPSDPSKITIDVVKNLPPFIGEEISMKALSNLDESIPPLQMTQIYTIPLINIFSQATWGIADTVGFDNTLGGPPQAMIGAGIEPDVTVYEHLEKEGITSEIITARTANGLYDYFTSKGLKIESGSIPVLAHYIGKEYSFIASWVTARGNIASSQVGVSVTFPTKDMYFPLLPTSVYGNKVVPATIRIIGHVSPNIFKDIANYAGVEYYVNSNAAFPNDLKNFYSGQTDNIIYTKIEINAPSRFFTDDLWINNQRPLKTYFATFIAINPLLSIIIALLLSSILAAMAVGMILFKELRTNPVKLGLLGLSNVFTLIGLFITTIFIRTKNRNESMAALLLEIRRRGYVWKRRVAIGLFFGAMPFLMCGLLVLPILISQIANSSKYIGSLDFAFVMVTLILYVLPVVAFIIGFVISRIHAEDKDLFAQLKLFGYSSWSFQPKDRMKYVFVPAFSIAFLIISWMLVTLAGYLV